MKSAIILLVTTAALVMSPAWAQVCKTNEITASTPSERFNLAKGTVADTDTGLMWMRCSLGQTWDGNTCQGQSTGHTWQAAKQAVAQLNIDGYGGYHDWRVPMMPELASIVERQCYEPRVNLDVFPQTPSTLYWSSMEKMGSKDQAYSLDFGAGAASPSLKSHSGHVRLVRGGPWWEPPQMPAMKKHE